MMHNRGNTFADLSCDHFHKQMDLFVVTTIGAYHLLIDFACLAIHLSAAEIVPACVRRQPGVTVRFQLSAVVLIQLLHSI